MYVLFLHSTGQNLKIAVGLRIQIYPPWYIYKGVYLKFQSYALVTVPKLSGALSQF